MSRFGKIARLSRPVRDELNRRLDRRVPGPVLVEWLNGLPEVQTIIAEFFNNDPISEQNLSNWRHGGFTEWQTRQEFLAQVQNLSADAAEIKAAADLADHAANLLSIHFALTLSHSLQPAAPSSSNPSPHPNPSPQENLHPPLPLSERPHPSIPGSFSSLRPLCDLARAIASIRRGNLAAARFHASQRRTEDDVEERAKALFIGAQVCAIRARQPLFKDDPAVAAAPDALQRPVARPSGLCPPPTLENEHAAAGPAALPNREDAANTIPGPGIPSLPSSSSANQAKSSYLTPSDTEEEEHGLLAGSFSRPVKRTGA